MWNDDIFFFKWFDDVSVLGKQAASSSNPEVAVVIKDSAYQVSIQPPRCTCGKPCVIKIASTARNSGREYYVCSSRACEWVPPFFPSQKSRVNRAGSFFQWCQELARNRPAIDDEKQRQDARVNGNSLTPYAAAQFPTTEYGKQSEESIQKDIAKLEAMLSNAALLATLPDHGERIRLKLSKLTLALSFKKRHPDAPATSRSETDLSAQFASSLNLADTGDSDRCGTKRAVLSDVRVLEESLAQKSNVVNVEPSTKLRSTLYPHQQLCFSWMYAREQDTVKAGGARGGIIADDMGLGKTIQMIALILSSHPTEREHATTSAAGSNATLIICPLAIATQWAQEIQLHTAPDSLRVRVHHGKHQLNNASEVDGFDVLITTYQTVRSCFKQKGGVLYGVDWCRIILDVGTSPSPSQLFEPLLQEAHVIKNYKSATAQAVFELRSRSRWLMSATPLQNRIQDMFSVFKFLRYAPFCEEDEWTKLFDTKFREQGIARLQPVLQGIMIRRTKLDKDEHGEPLVKLPSKRIDLYRLEFRERDKSIYDQINEQCRQNSVDDIFVKMLRLRQACNCMIGPLLDDADADSGQNPGPSLDPDPLPADHDVPRSTSSQDRISPSRGTSRLNKSTPLSEQNGAEDELMLGLQSLCIQEDCRHSTDGVVQRPGRICSACSDLITGDRIMYDICHDLCVECASAVLNNDRNCPVCGKKLPSGTKEYAATGVKPIISIDPIQFRSSPKMDFLFRNLSRIRTDYHEKAVVFSQWTTMLDLVGACLLREGMRTVRLDGSMSTAARESAIDAFRSDPDISVFLLSLKCAGVGLNLTIANHCFMLDTWWNYCIEDQAFCRIHRIGQTRPVRIYRLIIKDSIEEKILKLQRYKRNLAASVVQSDAGGALKSPKFSLKDLHSLL